MIDFDVRLDEMDGDVVAGALLSGAHVVRFLCRVQFEGRTVTLSGLHLDGSGPNTLGPRSLRRAMTWLMHAFDVDRIIVDGGDRMTGAAAGPRGTGPRKPSRLTFTREHP